MNINKHTIPSSETKSYTKSNKPFPVIKQNPIDGLSFSLYTYNLTQILSCFNVILWHFLHLFQTDQIKITFTKIYVIYRISYHKIYVI